ncbi:TPA: DUF6236 family protein [Escherichia coli]|uniref:DUF6236 family protein n=2 Tax=Klebsiella pneumoniae TaxID=573 RepID=UPI0013311A76|nr:DUF6236 family protein [Klebsiella pneumoniae]EIX9457218.1 hypothetical protein [Klebsiella pneumoniae]MDH8163314.1 DUF6236 family protein [Klebsiella pneumoniae]HBS7415458.1 hypothetical protein [Klebsiella pneumoniae]HBX8254839.1 hypothetical protein [Klebsiella pneumoniae]HCI7029209.1 hypothetical protein [Klebsiella pneumoniae]
MSISPRGIIVPNTDFKGGRVSGTELLSSQKLRYYLLYWDKVISVTNPIIGMRYDEEDITSLIKIGFIEERGESLSDYAARNGGVINFGGDGTDAILAETFNITSSQINAQYPGDFATHQFERNDFALPSSEGQSRSLEIELYSCFPCPPPNIPLGDIWCFRQRRADELMCLRESIDDLYLSMMRSGDLVRERTMALNQLRSAISDLNRVYDESWKAKYLIDRKFVFESPALSPSYLLASLGVGASIYSMTSSTIPSLVTAGLSYMLNGSLKIRKSNRKVKTILGREINMDYITNVNGRFVNRV